MAVDYLIQLISYQLFINRLLGIYILHIYCEMCAISQYHN